MTTTNVEAQQIAQTIRGQIAVGTFMTLGASDLAFQREPAGLTFKARIIPKGQTRPRVMRVAVTLNGLDYYDIAVTYPKRGKFTEQVTHYEASNVDCFQLNGVLFALDKEG